MGGAGGTTGLRAPSRHAAQLTEAEKAIDEALAESFPASDPPPWTLGLDPRSVYLAAPHESGAARPPLDGDA